MGAVNQDRGVISAVFVCVPVVRRPSPECGIAGNAQLRGHLQTQPSKDLQEGPGENQGTQRHKDSINVAGGKHPQVLHSLDGEWSLIQQTARNTNST